MRRTVPERRSVCERRRGVGWCEGPEGTPSAILSAPLPFPRATSLPLSVLPDDGERGFEDARLVSSGSTVGRTRRTRAGDSPQSALGTETIGQRANVALPTSRLRPIDVAPCRLYRCKGALTSDDGKRKCFLARRYSGLVL